MAQSSFSNFAQIFPRGENGLVVVAGLHALTAVVGILNQLVDGGGQDIFFLFLFVSLLQQRRQIGVPVVDKFVTQKMGYLEVGKIAFLH